MQGIGKEMLRIPFLRSSHQVSRLLTGVPKLCVRRSGAQRLRYASTTPYTPVNQIRPKIPDVLLIYHAGTWSTVFLGVIKVSTLLVFIFTAIVLAPQSYKDPDQGPWVATALVLGSTLPLLFMVNYTRPFVISIHLRVPMHARESATSLASFIDKIPATTRINISVMQTLPVPGTQTIRIGELRKLKTSFASIANLGLDQTGADLRYGSKSQPISTSFWKQSTNKFYVGRNTLPQQRSIIWKRIWSSIQ